MPETVLIEELNRYTRFTDAHRAMLARLGPLLEPGFEGIVDSFYEAIERTPRARAVFEDDEQILRQKQFLRRWMQELFSGTYDATYFASRARVGRAHMRIKLDQSFVVAAMAVVRAGLHGRLRGLDTASIAAVDRDFAHDSIDLVCDLDLAIMLETYRADYVQRIRTSEQLATLGQLAATIGHELRNPLAVMETSLHLLANRIPVDEKAARHVTRLGEQIDLCGTIVRDLLDLARDSPVERTWVDAPSLVAAALAETPGATDVVLDMSVSGAINVDPLKLRQVIVNLVTNALQSARHPSGVTLTVSAIDAELVVRVEDDGPGLSEEALARLFEPLFTTRARGVGLGLALCRRIAEKHGGSVRGGNRDEGGARFEARFADALPRP